MAPQFRHRAAVLVVFAAAPAFVVAALAAAGPAEAETEAPSPAPVTATATESGKQVVFSGGGLLGVSCAAQPSTRAVTVAADSTLKVVNRTGYRARLTLDGAVQGEIQDSASADVLFRRGPVTLSLKPNCVLSEESTAVKVHVQAPPPVPEEPSPAPAAPLPEAPVVPAGPKPSPSVSAAGSGGMPDAGAAPPVRRSAGAGMPDNGLGARPGPVAARPDRTSAADRVAVPGMPPGEDPLLVPGAPALDLPVAIGTPVDTVAAEPVAALDPLTATGPTGLLAIVATVCAAGVTAGAIRAITAQRANRALMV